MELIYNLLGNVKHGCRNYEHCSKKTSIYGILIKMFNQKCFSPKYLTWTSSWGDRQIQVVEHSLEQLFYSVRVMTTKKSQVRGLGWTVFSRLEETKETWKPNVTCDLWLNPWSNMSATFFQIVQEKLHARARVRVYVEKGRKNIQKNDKMLTVNLGEVYKCWLQFLQLFCRLGIFKN